MAHRLSSASYPFLHDSFSDFLFYDESFFFNHIDYLSHTFRKAVDAVAEALGDDGRILVRESGTEPVIRVMVEAATDELCEKYVTQVIDVIEKEGLIVE